MYNVVLVCIYFKILVPIWDVLYHSHSLPLSFRRLMPGIYIGGEGNGGTVSVHSAVLLFSSIRRERERERERGKMDPGRAEIEISGLGIAPSRERHGLPAWQSKIYCRRPTSKLHSSDHWEGGRKCLSESESALTTFRNPGFVFSADSRNTPSRVYSMFLI